MTEFFSPITKSITLPSGRPFQIRKGIHHLPDELTSSKLANELGIKPVGEMTDEEWAGRGYSARQRAEIMDRHGLVERPKSEPELDTSAEAE